MLSRIAQQAIRAGQQGRPVVAVCYSTQKDPACPPKKDPVCPPQKQPEAGKTAASDPTASGERDLVNFPRPVRQEFPGKVRMGFVPEEWFQFFYQKTGVTGPYALGLGLTTYILSKEILVMEHEYYTGLSLFLTMVIGIKKLGPGIAKYLDKEIDTIEEKFKESRESSIRAFNESAEDEKLEQWRAEGQKVLFDAKRENVALQLEAVYRERAMDVYSQVKNRLDYHVAVQSAEHKVVQKHVVQWVVNNVMKSITSEQEKESLQKCILDLKTLASKEPAY